MPSFTQRSFSGGVLAPALHSRSDTAKYQSGFADGKNMIVERFGSASSRIGTRFVTLPNIDAAPRLIPFKVDADTELILEFGNLYMRVILDGVVLGAPYVLTTPISLANALVMQTEQYGSVLYLVSSGFTPQKLTRTTNTSWTIENVLFTPSIERPYDLRDSTGLPAVGTITSDGTAPNNNDTVTIDTKVYTFKTTLTNTEGEVLIGGSAAAALDNLKSAINHSSGFGSTYYCAVAHPTVAATTNTATTQVVRARVIGTAGNSIATTETSSHLSWGGATLTSGTSDGTDTYRWIVTAYDSNGQESAQSDYVFQGSTTNTLTWDRVTNAAGYYIYKTQNNGQYGFIGTAAEPTSGTTVTFVDVGYTPDYADPPPVFSNPFETEYPKVVGIYQQRLIFANTASKPDGVWMSQVGFPSNFATRTPLQNDDAVIFQLASGDEVLHVMPIGGKLVLLTSGGEWQIRGGDAGVITPTGINAEQHSYNGCSTVLPSRIGDTALYIQRKSSIVRDLRFSFDSDSFAGSDLTVYAPHLVDYYDIVSSDYAQTPNSIMWCVRSDGTLIGLTYLREHQIWGWHEHESQLLFKSVMVATEDGEDVPYFVVQKPDGAYAIVRMVNNTFISTSDNAYLDCYLVYDGRNTGSTTMSLASEGNSDHDTIMTLTASSATFSAGNVGDAVVFDDGTDYVILVIESYTNSTHVEVRPDRDVPAGFLDVALTTWSLAIKDLTGLTALAEEEVSICADGYALGTDTVSAGGTLSIDTPHSVIFVGYPYTAEIETLDLDQPQSETLYDKKVLVREVLVRVQNTSSFKAGPDADNLQEYKSPNHSYDGGTTATNGNASVLITGSWGENTKVLIRQENPLPLTVQAVVRRCLISEN